MISDIAFFSERGARNVNQDAVFVSAKKGRGIFVTADGMGGHAGGEIASSAIVNGIKNWWDNHHLADVEIGIEQAAEQCSSLLIHINAEVYSYFSRMGQIGGSTAAVLIIWDDRYVTLSAGDSRIYRAKGKTLEQLTTDDVWENLPSVKYKMSNERVIGDARFGKLTEALGSDERLKISRGSGMLSDKEIFLLCTDGVHRYCSREKLEKIICGKKIFGSADRMKKKICKCVLKNGADDNYSAVICRIKRS